MDPVEDLCYAIGAIVIGVFFFMAVVGAGFALFEAVGLPLCNCKSEIVSEKL